MKMKLVILSTSLTMSVLTHAAPTFLGITSPGVDLSSSTESTRESVSNRDAQYKEIYEIAKVDISKYAIHGEVTKKLEVMVAGLAVKNQSTQEQVLTDLTELYKLEQSKN